MQKEIDYLVEILQEESRLVDECDAKIVKCLQAYDGVVLNEKYTVIANEKSLYIKDGAKHFPIVCVIYYEHTSNGQSQRDLEYRWNYRLFYPKIDFSNHTSRTYKHLQYVTGLFRNEQIVDVNNLEAFQQLVTLFLAKIKHAL